MHSADRNTAVGIIGGALGYLMLLTGLLGTYPGHNYDSYQYAYAVVKGPHLSSASLAEFSRMHVHSGYYPLWRMLTAAGLPPWAAFCWLNVLCTALTAGVIYLICRKLSVSRLLSAGTSVFFLSSTSVAYYAFIPEVYPPWMLFVAVFVLAAITERHALASIAFGLSLWMFLQSLLLWPLFWLRGSTGRTWRAALVGLALGTGMHLGTLAVYRVPFLPRLVSEKVYFRVITGWQWCFSSTWNALSLAGVLWVGLLYAAFALRTRKQGILRRMELLALPSLLAPAIWVKDHGSFFLPFILILLLLCAAALHKWVGASRMRTVAVAVLVLALLFGNVRTAWNNLGYDRSAGMSQLAYCRSALKSIPENSQVLSTALLSTWLWACAETGRDDVHCAYFPWMLRADYATILQASLEKLTASPGTYYVDLSVSSIVSEAGRIIAIWQLEVPAWPGGVVRWPLQVVDIGLLEKP